MPRRQLGCVKHWKQANIQSRPSRMSRQMAENINSLSVLGSKALVKKRFPAPTFEQLHHPDVTEPRHIIITLLLMLRTELRTRNQFRINGTV